MESNEIELIFRVWGERLDPEVVTEATGISPAKAFQVGERRGPAAYPVAGWEWLSSKADDGGAPLDEMMRVLEPHQATFRRCVDEGARFSVTVRGHYVGQVVKTAAEAERLRWYVREDRPFRTFLACDTIGVVLTPEHLEFLASVDADFETHIDVLLVPDAKAANWYEAEKET